MTTNWSIRAGGCTRRLAAPHTTIWPVSIPRAASIRCMQTAPLPPGWLASGLQGTCAALPFRLQLTIRSAATPRLFRLLLVYGGIGRGAHSVGAVGIDVRDVDLDRAVILGLDQAVGRRALTRDVKIDGLALRVLRKGRMPLVSNQPRQKRRHPPDPSSTTPAPLIDESTTRTPAATASTRQLAQEVPPDSMKQSPGTMDTAPPTEPSLARSLQHKSAKNAWTADASATALSSRTIPTRVQLRLAPNGVPNTAADPSPRAHSTLLKEVNRARTPSTTAPQLQHARAPPASPPPPPPPSSPA